MSPLQFGESGLPVGETAETDPTPRRNAGLQRVGRQLFMLPLTRNLRRMLDRPTGDLHVTAMSYDSTPEIGRIRSIGFAKPSGIGRKIHDSGKSQRDRFDDNDLGFQLVARLKGTGVSTGESIAHAMRINLPTNTMDCPISAATSGRWSPGAESLVFGRAVTTPKHSGYNHYSFMLAQAILLATATRRKKVAAVVVDSFPHLERMKRDFGFETIQAGNGKNGAYLYSLQGFEYSVFPIELEVNTRSVMAAHKLQERIFCDYYLPAGIIPHVDTDGIMKATRGIIGSESPNATFECLGPLTSDLFVA